MRTGDVAVALIGLAALLAWESAGLDLAVTRAYGSAVGFAWRDAWITRTLLHDGGRALAWGALALLALDAQQMHVPGPPRRERWFWVGVTLSCLLLVPTIKRLTSSSCPWDLAEFGGAARLRAALAARRARRRPGPLFSFRACGDGVRVPRTVLRLARLVARGWRGAG